MQADPVAPEGYHSLTPRMVVTDVKGAVQFLRNTFGARGEVVEGRPAEIRIGDSLVLLSEIGDREPFPAFLYVYVADAETIEAPVKTPYGDRRAMVRDPYGNVLQIAHRLLIGE